MSVQLSRYLPILDWGRTYNRKAFGNDMIAAVIVTIMLIPQSLAYALLAGLPPEAGLYASIAPILFYAIFGTSRALAVGPVAVVSLMTAVALEPNRALLHSYLGKASNMLGWTEQGLKDLAFAKQLDPTGATAVEKKAPATEPTA